MEAAQAQPSPRQDKLFPTCGIFRDADGEVLRRVWDKKTWPCFRAEDRHGGRAGPLRGRGHLEGDSRTRPLDTEAAKAQTTHRSPLPCPLLLCECARAQPPRQHSQETLSQMVLSVAT